MKNYNSPWMNDELRVLQDAVRQFYTEEFVPHNERWKAQGMVDRDAWTKAGKMGILCASIPEEYGGAGGNFAHDVVITQEQNRAGVNDFGNIGYDGPSPPQGTTHRYFFTLYAIDVVLDLASGASKKEVDSRIAGHVLAKTQIMGWYPKNQVGL